VGGKGGGWGRKKNKLKKKKCSSYTREERLKKKRNVPFGPSAYWILLPHLSLSHLDH
jgi:hypothetical protein